MLEVNCLWMLDRQMDRTTEGMNEDMLKINCLWMLDRQMDRTTEGMNEDMLRLTVHGCWIDRWIELQKG